MLVSLWLLSRVETCSYLKHMWLWVYWKLVLHCNALHICNFDEEMLSYLLSNWNTWQSVDFVKQQSVDSIFRICSYFVQRFLVSKLDLSYQESLRWICLPWVSWNIQAFVFVLLFIKATIHHMDVVNGYFFFLFGKECLAST